MNNRTNASCAFPTRIHSGYPTGDTTLYAHWVAPCSVTYDKGETGVGTPPTDSKTYPPQSKVVAQRGNGLTSEEGGFIGWLITGTDNGILIGTVSGGSVFTMPDMDVTTIAFAPMSMAIPQVAWEMASARFLILNSLLLKRVA